MAGHPRNFETEKEILDLWNGFKLKCDETPYFEQVATNKGIQTITKRKPYTRQGFESYVYNNTGKHIHQYLDNDGGNYEEYLGVVTHIRNEWEEDQISGTLAGIYKAPNLVARLNGYSDKQDTKTETSGEIVVKYVDGIKPL